MLTVKVVWPSDFANQSVYDCKHYTMMALADGTTSLILYRGIEDINELILGKGTRAYIMNDGGATVDTIYVPTANYNPLSQERVGN